MDYASSFRAANIDGLSARGGLEARNFLTEKKLSVVVFANQASVTIRRKRLACH